MNIFPITTLPKEKWWQKYVLRPGLRPIMLCWGNGKISHWWNWYNSNLLPQKSVTVRGDKTAQDRNQADKLSLIRASLGSWQRVAVIKPANAYQNWNWRIGFITKEKNLIVSQFCSILINGQVRVLIGPNDTNFLGLDKNGVEIKLEVVAITSRGDKKFKNIPLL